MVGWRIALWAVIVLAALTFFYFVRAILLPFVLALLLSVLLDPAVRKLRLRGMSRTLAVWTVMGSFAFVAVVSLVFLVPTVARQVGHLTGKVNELASQLTADSGDTNFFLRWNPRVASREPGASDQIDKFLEQNRDLLQRFNLPTSRAAFISRYIEPHKSEIANAVASSFGSLLGFVTGFGSKALLLLFTPIFTLFILLDLERFRQRTGMLIPPSIRKDTLGLLGDIGEVFGHYLRGVATVLLWYFITAAILLTVLGAPYSILLAILFALIYLVPFLGPLINAAVLVLVTTLSGATSNSLFSMPNAFTFAAVVTLIYVVLMFVFDQLVYARVVGRSVGLHPVVSFFVVFSGAALFGAIGMILAFPVAGSVKVILDRLFRFTSTDSEEALELPTVPLRHRAMVQAT